MIIYAHHSKNSGKRFSRFYDEEGIPIWRTLSNNKIPHKERLTSLVIIVNYDITLSSNNS